MVTDGTVRSERILYTPSAFAKKDLLYLQETGKLTAVKPHRSDRRELDSFLFFTVIAGCGTLEYRGNRYSLRAGDCVFIDCRLPYAHQTDTDRLWTLQWVHFYANTLPGIYEKYEERGGQPVFRPDSTAPYRQILEQLFVTASGDDYLRDMRINEWLARLLTVVMEMSWHPEKQPMPREGGRRQFSLRSVKQYLEDHRTEKITLEDLSKRFYINKFYLTRLFKEQYGIPVISYVCNLRITDAKQQLRFTEKTVEEIGRDCGFGDANYFSRVFRREEGMSPNEYRKRWR